MGVLPSIPIVLIGKIQDVEQKYEGLDSQMSKNLISKEEAKYKQDKVKYPKRNKTSKGIPFWSNSQASELLRQHVSDEMEGKAQRTKPQQLWESRIEYPKFPLPIFCKHIYQERTKQLAAPYWRHNRNTNASKKYKETEAMLKEWNTGQMNRQIGGIMDDWDKINM